LLKWAVREGVNLLLFDLLFSAHARRSALTLTLSHRRGEGTGRADAGALRRLEVQGFGTRIQSARGYFESYFGLSEESGGLNLLFAATPCPLGMC
jgi:hypothetical protein